MLDHVNGATRLFPIIGDPVRYTESPTRLTGSFGARGHNAVCVPMQVSTPALDDVMRGLAATPNIDGVLVTMPHKRTALRCATASERATLLGVVSVLRRNADGTWHGDMLDGLTFVKAQKDRGAEPCGARVLLLGAGGAGSAIAIALLEEGVQELIVHDVEEARAADLVTLLSGRGNRRVTTGPPDPDGCAMVCNATPLGMTEEDPLPLATGLLTASMFVGDGPVSGAGGPTSHPLGRLRTRPAGCEVPRRGAKSSSRGPLRASSHPSCSPTSSSSPTDARCSVTPPTAGPSRSQPPSRSPRSPPCPSCSSARPCSATSDSANSPSASRCLRYTVADGSGSTAPTPATNLPSSR